MNMNIDRHQHNPYAAKQEHTAGIPTDDPSHADSSTGGLKQEQETQIKLENVTFESLWDATTCLKAFLPNDDFPLFTFLRPMDLRKKAAAFALEQARALSQHYRQARKEQEEADRADGDASSSSDDDNPFAPPPPKSVRIDNEEDESLKHHQHFIASLPFCPMDVGFLPSKSVTDKCCYCPCHAKLHRWQEKFGVASDKCGGSTSFAPSGLVAHLEVMAFGQGKTPDLLSYGRVCRKYHWFVLCYLHALYADYCGPGIKHKAFYKMNTKEYNDAEQAEVRKLRSLMEDLTLTSDNKDRKIEELTERAKKMEEAIKLSPDINIKHENKRRQGLFDELGVAANSREDALHEKSETIYKDQFDSHIELWRYQLDAARHDGNPLQVKNVPVANFCLTDVFEKWSSPECKDAAFLFRSIGQKDAGRFLNKWMVYYQAATAARPKAKRLKADPHNLNELDAVDEESFTGKDEGGLTRNFLSDLWLHLGTLECGRTPKRGGVLLFDPADKKHLIPQTDDVLKEKLKKNSEDIVKSSTYYEAVGRVIAYCIGQKLPLASHILPDLYKVYLLKGISPKDPEYPIRDLIIHTCDLLDITQKEGMTLESILTNAQQFFPDTDEDDENGDQKTHEAQFRNFVHDQLIAQRSLALKALTAGITLNGRLKPSTCFFSMPLAAINKFLFCHATIRIEDVLGALVPRYSRATNAMKKSLDREYQERVLSKDPVTGEVSGVIVDIIKELTEEELQDFIWFVTGWKYVPRSGLTITVEFNHVEAKEDSLPVAHTCTQDLKLPGEAYKAEKETLKEKLKTSIEEVKQGSHFDMN